MDLITKIQNGIAMLRQHIEAMKNWGIKKANAERDYHIALSKETLKERDKGTAIGVITLTVKGSREVAEKRMQRDIAEVMYDVAKENVNADKLELRILDAQAQREWSVRE